MRSRQRVNRRVDRRVFKRTAAKTHALNIPGQIMQRGGTRL